MVKEYKGSTVEECLEMASTELNINKKNLKYEVIEVKKGFFRKKAIISVEIIEDIKDIENEIKDNSLDGTIEIINGDMVIKNPKEGGKPAFIIVPKDAKVIVDSETAEGKVSVFENSKIEVLFEESMPRRIMDIKTSEDYMEAYLNIEYIPQVIFKLKDKSIDNSVRLDKEIKEKIFPNKYNLIEIKEELSKCGIVYGIIEENIEKYCVADCNNVLIAKGEAVEDDEDDALEIKFPIDNTVQKLDEDNKGTIDYKSIGAVKAVQKGDVICIKRCGKKGKDGKDIHAKIKRHKPGQKLRLRNGEGCIIKDGNTVISLIEGKPCIKNNVFYVYPLHEVSGDVDLKTGNIKFVGDVKVYGNVKEGMEIDAGNSIEILKNVERADITAKGNIDIKGNIIFAKVSGGGEDVIRHKEIEDLLSLKEDLKKMIVTIEEIKKFNLLGENKKDGEIVKALIENKFRKIPKLCISILTDIKIEKGNSDDERVAVFIRNKLLGMGPISIKQYCELEEIIECIDEKIALLDGNLDLPVNVKISYCQDSLIQSSGDIMVVGKGQYVSNIIANNGVYFLDNRGVARGGTIKANNEIKCKIVGSEGGVVTRLEVSEKGHIWVETAYQSTVFAVGKKEFVLETPSKDIHAYLNDKNDIIVDRLML